MALVGLGLVPLFSLGCEKSEEQARAREEPWLRDEGPDPVRRIDRRLHLAPAAGQWLRFELGGKAQRVAGRVPVAGGRVRVDPDALEHVRGEILFDLDHLEVQDDTGEVDPEASAEARRWLGLGARVERSVRARRARASFRVESARALSARAAFRGEGQRGAEQGAPFVTRVRATVSGDLSLLGVEVLHSMRAELDFTFPESPAADVLPEAVVVRLLERDRVPLVEHRIAPRDEAGIVRADVAVAAEAALGAVVQVSGELRLVRPSSPVLQAEQGASDPG